MQGKILLSVTAQDEETPHLGFEWKTNIGTLEVPFSTGTTSEVNWSSPSCVPEGTVILVTVTVTKGGHAGAGVPSYTLSAVNLNVFCQLDGQPLTAGMLKHPLLRVLRMVSISRPKGIIGWHAPLASARLRPPWTLERPRRTPTHTARSTPESIR